MPITSTVFDLGTISKKSVKRRTVSSSSRPPPPSPIKVRHFFVIFFWVDMVSWDHDQDFETNLFFSHCEVAQHLEKFSDFPLMTSLHSRKIF